MSEHNGGSNSVEAILRMMGAVASDVAGAATRRESKDPFAIRDPEYIARTLPVWRKVSHLYFRADVRGLGHIPAEGPVLLVGNHSGGIHIADTFVFAQSFYDHLVPSARFTSWPTTSSSRPRSPGARAALRNRAGVPAEHGAGARARRRPARLPGRRPRAFRPSWKSDEIDFAQRAGFIKLALKHNVKIVPVVSIGGQETGLFLGQGSRLAGALKLNSLARLKVLPAVVGPPLGISVLDFPLRLPLPSKITIRVLKPIDLRERLGEDPSIEEGYRLVTSTMQRMLTRLGNERTLPVVG